MTEKPTKPVLDKKDELIAKALKDVEISENMQRVAKVSGAFIKRQIDEAEEFHEFRKRLLGVDFSEKPSRTVVSVFEGGKKIGDLRSFKLSEIVELRRCLEPPGEEFQEEIYTQFKVPREMIFGKESEDDRRPIREEAVGDDPGATRQASGDRGDDGVGCAGRGGSHLDGASVRGGHQGDGGEVRAPLPQEQEDAEEGAGGVDRGQPSSGAGSEEETG